MTYTINYDPISGKVVGIVASDGRSIPIDATNADFRAFVAANTGQDYTTPIVPPTPSPAILAARAAGARLRAAYPLSAVTVQNANDILLVLNGVIQSLP
jgi:hypothetical protein